MARKKMRKFSEGGEAARSAKINKRYDRKVADIDSDYKKALAKGKNADVAKAKYEQRMADAADDRAKWTGGDRTQTRAAEKAAEKNLSMTRKYGPRSSDTQVAKAESKLADKAPLSSVDTSALTKAKTPSFKEAFRAAREKGVKTFTWDGKPGVTFTTQLAGAAPKRTGAGKATVSTTKGAPAKADARKAPVDTAKGARPANVAKGAPPANVAKGALPPAGKKKASPWAKDAKGNWVDPNARGTRMADVMTLGLTAAARNNPTKPTGAYGALAEMARKKDELEAKRKAEEAKNRKANIPVSRLQADPYGFYGKKKGGTVKKYNKGGMPKEPVTGGSGTVPLSPERKKFLDQMRKQNEEAQKQGKREGRAAPGHKAGGKIMKKSDKAGRALVKKSADTMGRAMVKKACGGKMKGYAKGGSIDGVAVKGKTRCKGAK